MLQDFEKRSCRNYLFPKSRIPDFRKPQARTAAENIRVEILITFLRNELLSDVEVMTRFTGLCLENCFSS